MVKKLKGVVSFTCPSYHALINKSLKSFEDRFYGIFKFRKTETLIFCEKIPIEKIQEIALFETFILSKLFFPEEGYGDIADNSIILPQIMSLISDSQKEKVKWRLLENYITETYSVSDIIEQNYKEWFKIDSNSIFIKLLELINDAEDFISYYVNLFKKADIIIPFSNFIFCDNPPIDLSFLFSQLSSSDTYSNYWLFYFPLRFSKYIRCELTPISEVIGDEKKSLLEMTEKYNKAQDFHLRVYQPKKSAKNEIWDIFKRNFKKRAETAPFIQNDLFELISSPSLREEFQAIIREETIEEIEAPELVEFLKAEMREAPVIEYFIPVRILNITSIKPVEFMDWSIYGRTSKRVFGVHYFDPSSVNMRKIRVEPFINPFHEKSKPIVLDTSILHSDVWNDVYFNSFSEYFLSDRKIIIPSLSLYELFATSKWREKPPTFIRELKEHLFCKELDINTDERISVLTLISTFQFSQRRYRKNLRYAKERSRDIRDMDILTLAKEEDAVLITADKKLHKFAFTLGIPSVRYIRKKELENLLKKEKSLSQTDRNELQNEIDKLILGGM